MVFLFLLKLIREVEFIRHFHIIIFPKRPKIVLYWKLFIKMFHIFHDKKKKKCATRNMLNIVILNLKWNIQLYLQYQRPIWNNGLHSTRGSLHRFWNVWTNLLFTSIGTFHFNVYSKSRNQFRYKLNVF